MNQKALLVAVGAYAMLFAAACGDGAEPEPDLGAGDAGRPCSTEGESYCEYTVIAWTCTGGHWVQGVDGPCWNRDGGPDLGPDYDAGAPCSTPDVYECFGDPAGYNRWCCGGVWRDFLDSPCGAPLDAGTSDCASSPIEPGCPCASEGATSCRFLADTVRCTGGTWQELPSVSCCAI